jgi:membrane protein YdbS with pleckstrin-like domain
MRKEWYVRQSGRTKGPYTANDLKQRVANAVISNQAEIANETAGPWHPIVKLKGLPWPAAEAAAVATSIAPQPVRPLVAQQGETLAWKGTPSQLTNLRTFFWCTLFFWLVVPIFVAIWRILQTRSTIYELTNERLKTHSGVIAKHTEEIELHRIRDSAFTQSIFDRIVGLGTIRLNTNDTSSPIQYIAGISAKVGKELRENIRKFSEQRRLVKGVREFDSY